MQGHTDWVRSAAYSPDSQHIVTASDDRTVRVWKADGSDKDHPLVLQGHTDWVRSAAYSPDSQHIVTASDDRTVRIWTIDIPTLQQRLRTVNHDCLPRDVRQTYLLETEAEAGGRYEACRRSLLPSALHP